MGTAITPQLVDVIDVFSAQRFRSCGATDQLTECRLERWGLSLECPTPEDSGYDSEIMWFLPDLGLRLSRLRTRKRHARRSATVLTAFNVEWDTQSWRTTNLLLGLELPEDGPARVVRAEEFGDAVSEGAIRLSEADYAFRTVHRTLSELGHHRDLNQWLAFRGVFDTW